MGQILCGLLLSLSGLVGGEAPSRAAEAGRLFNRTYGSAELGADPQNWAVTQDAQGRIYAGNNLGLLEHDGVRWRLMPTRLGTTPRALAADAQGRVYFGGQGEFGWVGTDATGQRQLIGLEDRLPTEDRAFSQIWSVCATEAGVYFSAKERLFRWDGQRLDAWRSKGGFFSGYAVGKRYLILDKGQGLMEVKGGTLALVPGGEAFREARPRFMVEGPEGSLLWGSRTQGLVRFAEGRNTPLLCEANAYLLKHLLYAGLALRDGSLALGTIHGGVLIVDGEGHVRRVVSREGGLGDATVYALHEDRRTGLWLGQSTGVTYLEWPARFSRFDADTGLDGVVVAVHRHQGRLYASTQRGLFRLEASESQRAGARFVRVPGIQGQCWNLLSLGERLLVANFDGLYEVRGPQARKIPVALGHSLALLPCPWDPRRLLVGTDRGLFSVDPDQPKAAPVGPLGGFEEVIQTLVAAPDGSVWVGCDAPLAYRVAKGPRGELGATRFGQEWGLPASPWYHAVSLPEGPVLLAASGIFHLTGQGRFERLPGSEGLSLEGADFHRLAFAPEGGLWVGFQRPGHLVRHARRTSEGRYAWEEAPAFSFLGSQVYALLPEADGVTWFGGVEGLFRVAEGGAPSLAAPSAPGLRMTRLQGGVVAEVGSPGEMATPRLPYAERNLRFEFALPKGEQAYTPRYQVRLEGQEVGWSAWSTEAYRDYPGLREGSYRFLVRAQAGVGGAVGEARLAFRILAPWYRRPWAYGLYLLVAAALLGLLHRLRMRVLERRADRLARQVEAATHELRTANHALQELSEQKSRFMALVTHDLRNPLHGIALAAEQLQSLDAPEAMARLGAHIERESLEMDAMVGRFLDAAAWDAEGARIQWAEVALGPLLEEAVARHEPHAARKDIHVQLELPGEPLVLRTDLRMLGSVVDNLLSNALKFSPLGSTVRVGAEAHGEELRLWVRDEGPGFTEADRPRLFTRHARLSARPTGGEGSMGLGLALTRDLVTALGGQLDVESVAGAGACLVVTWPRVNRP